MEVMVDTRPPPGKIPADTIAVLVWNDADPPPDRWEVAGFVTGAKDIDTALEQAVHDLPTLDGKYLLGTKVGARSGTEGRYRRREQVDVTVEAMK